MAQYRKGCNQVVRVLWVGDMFCGALFLRDQSSVLGCFIFIVWNLKASLASLHCIHTSHRLFANYSSHSTRSICCAFFCGFVVQQITTNRNKYWAYICSPLFTKKLAAIRKKHKKQTHEKSNTKHREYTKCYKLARKLQRSMRVSWLVPEMTFGLYFPKNTICSAATVDLLVTLTL